MDNTIIQQGTFTGSGAAINIVLRSDVDWMRVVNLTEAAAQNNDHGFEYFWQRGMVAGRGIVYYHPAADHTVAVDQLAAGTGFTLIDTSDTAPGARYALTDLTVANPPVITSATLPPLGSIVRLGNLDNQTQFAGIDFTVTVSGAGTFSIGNIVATNTIASTAGYWRQIPYDPIFYPRRRIISYVRVATQAVIYLTVTHGYTVGQKVRLNFPGGSTKWGDYAKLHNQLVTITAINTARAGNEPTNALGDNNIVVDFDTTGYTAWEATFAPAGAQYPPTTTRFTPPTVVPVGIDTATALVGGLDLLSDATEDTSYIGMQLAGGTKSPAGDTDDVIYWVAGKSFSIE